MLAILSAVATVTPRSPSAVAIPHPLSVLASLIKMPKQRRSRAPQSSAAPTAITHRVPTWPSTQALTHASFSQQHHSIPAQVQAAVAVNAVIRVSTQLSTQAATRAA